MIETTQKSPCAGADHALQHLKREQQETAEDSTANRRLLAMYLSILKKN